MISGESALAWTRPSPPWKDRAEALAAVAGPQAAEVADVRVVI
ncbi:MAG TPA: hypothetical protein VKB58_14780 [Terriglobales bacterium]|nr:hypothetical protein [Terriglobales bacterium]